MPKPKSQDEIPTAIGRKDIKAAFKAGYPRVRCSSSRYQHTSKLCSTLEEAMQFLKYMEDGPPNTNEIVGFFHCGLCLESLPKGMSPREWSQLEVGFTPHGIQVWCKRHECNVAHLDLEGHQHPCDQTRQDDRVIAPAG